MTATMRMARGFLILCWPAVAQSQPPKTLTLSGAGQPFAESFSRVTAVRELDGQRVLVYDAKENRLVALNWQTGRVEDLTRIGEGPGEFRVLTSLLKIAGDSTLAPDQNLRRWLVLSGTTVVGTVAADHPSVRPIIGGPLGSDIAGSVVGMRVAIPKNGRMNPNDSLEIIVVDRRQGALRVVARAGSPFVSGDVAATGKGNAARTKPMYHIAASASDQVTMSQDGAVAIVRTAPYRVEWVLANGERIVGASLLPKPIAFDDKSKASFLRWTRATTDWPPTDNLELTEGWPALVPAFVGYGSSALFPMPDGRLLVERTRVLESGAYDIVDRRGARVAVLTVGAHERIVGCGTSSIYIVRADNDGVETLVRYPWK